MSNLGTCTSFRRRRQHPTLPVPIIGFSYGFDSTHVRLGITEAQLDETLRALGDALVADLAGSDHAE